MVGFVLAVGAGFAVLYNWASSVYSYNRDAWMTDIQVEQNHVYQRDNLKIARRGMEREEVRDFIEAYITSINNSVLVATLILAIAGEMLIEGQIPTTCAAFVLNAYMLCLGSAILHLVLSILFGVFASHAAYRCSTKMLTDEIRPNWKKHFEKMDQRRSQREVTQAFEHKPIYAMLRPPLAARLISMMTAGNGQPSPAAMDKSTQEPLVQSGAGLVDALNLDSSGVLNAAANGRQPSDCALSRAGSFESQARRPWDNDRDWRRGWRHSEMEWFDLRSCMFKCVVLGTRNLLEACGYLCMGNLYGSLDKDAWAFWAVQIIFISLNVIMMVFLIERIKSVKKPEDFRFVVVRGIVALPSGVIALLPATGPISCIISAATPWVNADRVLVPFCYISHCLVTCVLCIVTQEELLGADDEHKGNDVHVISSSLGEVSHLWRILCGRSSKQTLHVLDTDEEPSTFDPESEFGEELFPLSPASPTSPPSPCGRSGSQISNFRISSLHTAEMPLTMLCWGMVMICLLWLSACVWVLVRMLQGMDLKNNDAIFGERHGPPLVVGNIMKDYFGNVISPYFEPHYMVCPREQVFFADTFHVFEKTDGGINFYKCPINGTIQDLGAKCNRDTCWPLVLLHQTPTISSALVDCRSGMLLPLLQTEEEVEFIGMHADDTPESYAGEACDGCYNDDTLIAASRGKVIQYKWSEKWRAFEPWWIVKDLRDRDEDPVVALDLVEESLLIFYKRGVVECQNMTSGGFCGRWTLQMPVLGGGCAYKENGTAVRVLVEHQRRGVVLMSADMPRRTGRNTLNTVEEVRL